jgi:hypothetical protein
MQAMTLGRKTMFSKILSVTMSMLLVMGSFSTTAAAAVIGTQDALATDSRQSLLTSVQAQLAREDVRQAMINLGVDPEQAAIRVASLDSRELAQLGAQLDSLPAGGSILALIGAVFVVLLILEVTGVTNVFTKV